jgi:hypothetical protein
MKGVPGMSAARTPTRWSLHHSWFAALNVAELALAFAIPANAFEKMPWTGDFAAWLADYVHVINRFDSIAVSPDRTELYLALTVCLVPLKILFFFIWLNRDRLVNYLSMVVSPLTNARPTVSDFVLSADSERRPEIQKRAAIGEPRPLLERVAWSLAILAFAALMVFDAGYLFGYEIPKGATNDLRSVQIKYRAIAEGGLSMWFWWAFVQLNVVSLVLAAAVCVLRDYAVWFGRWFLKGIHHERC